MQPNKGVKRCSLSNKKILVSMLLTWTKINLLEYKHKVWLEPFLTGNPHSKNVLTLLFSVLIKLIRQCVSTKELLLL